MSYLTCEEFIQMGEDIVDLTLEKEYLNGLNSAEIFEEMQSGFCHPDSYKRRKKAWTKALNKERELYLKNRTPEDELQSLKDSYISELLGSNMGRYDERGEK